MSNKSFANRDVLNLVICDYATQKPILNCAYANTTSNAMAGEAVYAYGGQGHPKRVPFYGDKGGTFTIETQLMSAQLYRLLTGAAAETTATFIKRVEKTAVSGVITLDAGTAPIADSVNVFAADDDCGTPVKATVSNATITLEDSSSNAAYIVYYMEQLTTGVQRFNIKSTTFPRTVTIYGETYMKTEDDEILPYKLLVYKAAPQVNFEMSFSNSGDPASVTITFDLLADDDDNMLDMLLLDEAG